MPFKSKAQQRFMFSAEERGDLPKGTAERWAEHTSDIKALPEHKTASLVVHDVVSNIKGLTGPLDHVRILAIDGAKARQHDQSFSVGGHHYVYPWIPEDEVWIEAGLSGKDLSAIIVHELAEREIMKRLRLQYEQAHKISNTCEEAVRILLGKDDGETQALHGQTGH